MKVIELYENQRISTAKEFKDSFTPDEWASIMCQLVSISKIKVGISSTPVHQDKDSATQLRTRLEKTIGPGISDNESTSTWNGHAIRNNIRVPSISWQSFHNHLKQYVGKPCNVEFSNTSSPAQRNVEISQQLTPETIDDIIGASPSLPDPMSYDQAIQFRTNAFKLVINATQRKTPDAQGYIFKDWVNTVSNTVPAPEGDEVDQRKVLFNRLVEVVPDNNHPYPVTKKYLALRFLAWLRMADGYIKTSRERFDN